MPRPIASKEELIANVLRFETVAPELKDVIGYNRAWYAVRKGGKWKLGPSKFVGYFGLSARDYLRTASTNLDGRTTENAIAGLARPIQRGDAEFDEVWSALVKLCGQYDRRPSVRARLAIVDLDDETGASDELVEFMAAVFRKLDSRQRVRFRELIGA